MALPTFVAAGAATGAITAITPALPAGIATNDILLLYIETANQAITIADAGSGTWTEATASPSSVDPTRLTIFWSRYDGAQTAPTTSDSGDHQYGRIFAFRGCLATGNPINVAVASNFAEIEFAFPSVTTTVAECMIVMAIANDADLSTAFISDTANANLASITERQDAGTTVGNGGELAVVTGTFSGTGAIGVSDFVFDGSGTDHATHTLALAPAAGGAFTIDAAAGAYSITGTAATLRAARIIAAAGGSYGVTGEAAGLRAGHRLAAVGGSYGLTGTAAGLKADRVVAADGGTYVVTGTDATLTFGGVAASVDYVMIHHHHHAH